MGIGDLFEGFRRWLDGEDATDEAGQPKPRSKWEDFMVAIAREIGAVMQREMFTPPGGPTYIPREYIVFLSPDDDAEWQGEKREGLERGLHYVLTQRARELAGSTEFQTKTLAVEMRTDANLGRGQFRIQPVWDKEAERTMVTPRKPPAAAPPTVPSAPPRPASTSPLEGVSEESTLVRPRTRAGASPSPLFAVDVAREVAGPPAERPTAPPDVREFFKPKITIGRGSKQVAVDLRLEGDLELSREHASFELQDGHFVVTCLGRNSIFVEKLEVLTGESAIVQPGQSVTICSYVLKPRLPEPGAGRDPVPRGTVSSSIEVATTYTWARIKRVRPSGAAGVSRGVRPKAMNSTKSSVLAAVAAFALTTFAAGAAVPGVRAGAQDTRAARPEVPADEVIRRFAESESRLRDARNNYTFKQDVTLQTLVGSNTPTGTFRRVSEIVFDDQSKRIERITYFPQSTLAGLNVTQEDLQDLGIIQPFALTTEELPKYTVRPAGRERIDEINTYVFDVAPKDPRALAKAGQRYFTGRVWVEDQDFMIVKVQGKAGPEVGNNRYPRFETYRENIDGKFWFPTYTYADDVLAFENGDIHMRMVVKYTDYREFTGNITIVGEEPAEGTTP